MNIKGTNNADNLIGSSTADIIWAKGGNDTVNGGAGNDIIGGGSGNDVITGGAGNDALYGGTGNDQLFGGTGINSVWGGEGTDTLWIKGPGSYGGGNGADKFSINIADFSPTDATTYLYGGKDGSKDTADFDNAKQSDFTIKQMAKDGSWLITHKETGAKFEAYSIEKLTFDGKAYTTDDGGGPTDPGPGPTIEEQFMARYVEQDTLYQQNGYYDVATNKLGINIALDYFKYLDNGGEAFDALAKDTATREQTLHDNFLGNLTEAGLVDRGLLQYAMDKATEMGIDISDVIQRPYYSGNDGDEQAELNSVAWDYDHGINRDDYDTFTTTESNNTLSVKETDSDGDMVVGDGIPTDNFHTVTHNATGVSMSIKADQFGGVYDDHVAGNTYTVEDGVSSLNGNRADHSMYFSIETGLNGSDQTVGDATTKGDLDIGLWFDADPTEAENFIFIVNAEEILDNKGGTGVDQNSWNMGFNFLKGLMPDEFVDDFKGEAFLGWEMRLTDVDTGDVLAINHINIHQVDTLL